MYNIGVIGDYDSICGFSAMGFNIFPVESADQARRELRALASGGYGIIFITEPYMEELSAECDRFNDQWAPSIIPIPACTGVTGFGISRLKRYVIQAAGSDIVFND